MKYLPFTAGCLAVIIGVLIGDWKIREHFADPLLTHPLLTPSLSNRVTSATSGITPPEQWQAYERAREKALHDDPQLAGEFQQVKSEMEKQNQEIDLAAAQVDPRVVPIMDKLNRLRQGIISPRASGTAGHP